MKHYIFLFTLSPVQSFIAQARKTQDLYAGSQILSELARTAAIVATTQNIKLVFPTATEGGASFPNRFLGTIEGEFSPEDLQQKGENIEKSVNHKFKELANAALKKVKIDAPTGFYEQINNHLDINWLFHEIENSDYKTAYKAIEPLMASLKNIRFITNPNPEAGRKCSLDGERNALFRGQNTTNSQLKRQAIEINGDKTRIWLDANEGLSAVSLVKRTYQKEEFPSTAQIALAHQLKKLEQAQQGLVDIYKKLFSSNYKEAINDLLLNGYVDNISYISNGDIKAEKKFNYQFFLEENLTEKNISDTFIREVARKVQQKYFKNKLTDKYYALITFDGDKMGELLSGARLTGENIDLAIFQSDVSKTLIDFSKWICDTLNKKQLDVIYAGGDDFMGFVNLHDLFEVVKTLRIEFEKQVNQAIQKKYSLKNAFTFSMGIAIAHYKTPLSIVLQTARDMEKIAKKSDKGNRDAFAIAALKHSGENHSAYFNWELSEEENLPKWAALQKLVGYLQNDCSETFIRSLDREFYYLQDKDKNIVLSTLKDKNNKPLEIKPEEESEKIKEYFGLYPEIKRLVAQSVQVEDAIQKKKIAQEISEIIWTFISYKAQTSSYTFATQNALELLKIALFLKRETKKDL